MPRRGGLHYTKSGRLDMRYSSSKAAVSSGSSGGSYRSSSSSYGGRSSGGYSSGVVLKKDGTPDMRYKSSKAAVASSSASSGGRWSGGVVLKKDGTPDMRYKSSKAAVANTSGSSSNGVVLKKDGTPDMRYKSSRQTVAGTAAKPKLHYKRDGTLDMRFKSSREHARKTAGGSNRASRPSNEGLHFKKDGTLDMRYATSKMVTAIKSLGPPRELRRKYVRDLCANQDFVKMACSARDHWDGYVLPPSQDILPAPSAESASTAGGGEAAVPTIAKQVGVDVQQFEYASLGVSDDKELGSGAFGIVYAGSLSSGTAVAVKKLHIGRVGKKKSAKKAFVNELKVMARLGQHRNILALHGYCESPLALVLEFAELGSLAHVLYHEKDKEIECNMLVGKLKKSIGYQIADGLRAMHVAGCVHRDIKADNVLLTKDYVPKVCDFGLSMLRGATISSVNSQATSADTDGHGAVGTMAYMDPALLDFDTAHSEATDVYSYGILLNELATMEQPYSDVLDKFVGRGPAAPALYAKTGHRPTPPDAEEASAAVTALIQSCWNCDSKRRPTFAKIVTEYATNAALVFEDQFDEDQAPTLPASTVQQMGNLQIK